MTDMTLGPPPEGWPMETPTGCPSWCRIDHARDGDRHSGVIGSAMVGGEEISVLLTQAPGGKPSVMLYGPIAVGVDEIDHGGVIALLELCGQRALAALVSTAVGVRARELIAARRIARRSAARWWLEPARSR